MPHIFKILSIIFLCAIIAPSFVYAQDSDVDVVYAGTPQAPQRDDNIAPTDPDIRLSPDKSELIRLPTRAKSVIVGNPQHLSVLIENNQTLVLVPQLPGATYISVLDKNTNVIMQRHVIVAAPQDNYIRIRRSCASGGDEGCKQTQVFYCPGACHEIGLTQQAQETGTENAAANVSSSNLPSDANVQSPNATPE